MKFSLKLFVVFLVLSGCEGGKNGLEISRGEYWAEDSAAKINVDLETWPSIKTKQLSDTCNYRFSFSSDGIAELAGQGVPDSIKLVVSALKGGVRLWLNNVEGELRLRGGLSTFVFPVEVLNQSKDNEVVLKVVDVTGEGGLLEPIRIQGIDLADRLEIDLKNFYRLDLNGEAGDQLSLYNRGGKKVEGRLLVAVRSLTNDWKPTTSILRVNLAAGEREEISVPIKSTTNPVAVELFFKSGSWHGEEFRLKDTLSFGIHGN